MAKAFLQEGRSINYFSTSREDRRDSVYEPEWSQGCTEQGRCVVYIIVRGNFTLYSSVCFVVRKSDAAIALKRVLADTPNDSLPKIVISDGGGNFCGGEFSNAYVDIRITQLFTTAKIPQFYGVAESTCLVLYRWYRVQRTFGARLFSRKWSFRPPSHGGWKPPTGRATLST